MSPQEFYFVLLSWDIWQIYYVNCYGLWSSQYFFLFNFQEGNLQLCVFILLYLSIFPIMIFPNKSDLRARIVKLLSVSHKFDFLEHFCWFVYDCFWEVTVLIWSFPTLSPIWDSTIFPLLSQFGTQTHSHPQSTFENNFFKQVLPS